MTETPRAAAPRQSITPAILLVLTAVTGVVDAVAYLGLGHVFTANMTGNVVLLGFALAQTGGLYITRSLAALVCFFAGATLGGRVAPPRAPWSLVWESGLLFMASIAALVPVPTVATYSVIVITALAMGYRNAVVRKLAIPDLTTTVLTLTITGLGADSGLAGGANPRWRRRFGAILAMVAGAYAGALLVKRSAALALFVSALIAGSCAIAALRLSRKETL